MKRGHGVSHPTKLVLCLLIILTLFVAMSVTTMTVYAAGQEEVRVEGRVVDEDGEELNDIKLEVFSKGALVTSKYTDSNFHVYLQVNDTYTLNFSKSGYAKATKSIYLGDEEIDLEDIVLLKALRLSSPVLSRVASSGEKLMLPFTVSNIGEEPEEVEFSVSKPEGWSTRILDQTGEVTKVYLSTGVSLNLQLETTIPLTSTGSNSLSLTADGKTKTTLKFTITVEPSNESIISCQFPGKSTTPGDTVQFQVRVKNPFGVEMRFRVAVDSIPLNWTAFVKSVGGEAVTEVTLDSSEFIDLIIEVTPPVTAGIGEYGIVVKAVSSDGNVTAFLTLNITLTVAYAISLEPSTLLTSATVGGSTTFTAKITNTGQTPVIGLWLNVDAPQGWDISITPAQVESLKPRESFTFTIVVKTPDDTVAGDYLLTLKGLSDQVESDEVQIRVMVTAPTSWGLIGIGIAAVVIVALIVVFKKFRRR